jgi:hypothetical protein
MITCEHCGKVYQSNVTPLRCRCGGVTGATSEPVRPNAWQVIHTRYANAIESYQWSETVERHWLDTDFAAMVPCGSCGNKWQDIKPTIDLSTAESAFRSVWQAHNTVSTEHVQPAKQPISYELCLALYLQQPSMDDCCIAVTSLSLLPNHLQVQDRCLNSWKRAGLTVHSKNQSGEVDQLKDRYPQVDQWHICDVVPEEYKTRTQSIHALAQTAAEIGQRIILINSDIEIHGEQRIIREAVEDGVLVGIRHDYKDHWWTGTRFIWGLDVFSFTPDQARSLPYLPFAIGKPIWDYWLPQHFKTVNQKTNFVGDPFFFHKLHKTNWNEDEWNMGAKWFADTYGFMRTQPESVVYRKSLPFPPP